MHGKKGIVNLDLTWKHVSELRFWECSAAEAYGVRSIPSNVLIGPDGTIVARNLMGHDLYNKLAELLDQPASSKQKQEKKIGLIVQANYRITRRKLIQSRINFNFIKLPKKVTSYPKTRSNFRTIT